MLSMGADGSFVPRPGLVSNHNSLNLRWESCVRPIIASPFLICKTAVPSVCMHMELSL